MSAKEVLKAKNTNPSQRADPKLISQSHFPIASSQTIKSTEAATLQNSSE